MIIDCVSDLHGYYPQLEGGDLLIVAGDFCMNDDPSEIQRFKRWVCEQKYEKIVLVPGNHDNFVFEGWMITPKRLRSHDVGMMILEDQGCEFRGLKIWGSPWTLKFPGMNPKCMAFTVDTEEELAEKWAMIPDDTDILVTHMPPWGCGDDVKNHSTGHWEHKGSQTLLSRWMDLSAKVHVYGHIHEGYGIEEEDGYYYVNASHVNSVYDPVNKPIRIEL